LVLITEILLLCLFILIFLSFMHIFIKSKKIDIIDTDKMRGLKLPNFWVVECVEPSRLGVDMFVRNVKR